jgi:D-sedoheptulose 7-phosphate isomerase
METLIKSHLRETQEVLGNLTDDVISATAKSARIIIDAIKSGHRVFICGNGGSAADASHIAGELINRLIKERRGLPAQALTTDISSITSIANDYDYKRIFSRQIEALAKNGDILLAISTSGSSANIIQAADEARARGLVIISITGTTSAKLSELADIAIIIPSTSTQCIQETYMNLMHSLCAIVEAAFVVE